MTVADWVVIILGGSSLSLAIATVLWLEYKGKR